MNKIKNKILQEQTNDKPNPLDFELGMQMSSLGPIPKTKKQAAEVIKRIFNSSNQEFYKPGNNIPLGKDLNTIKDKVRFFEYGKSFQAEKEGRGFNFEGMLAGLFNGIPIVSKAKEDIVVGGVPYSVKSAEPGSSFDSGTLIYGFRNELVDMVDNGVDTTGINTPYDLLKKEGEEYTRFKIAMLTSMFTSSDGTPIEWIFSIIYPNYIEYTVWSTDDLINELVINPGMIGVGRNPRTDVRMKSRFLMQNPSVIQFPSFTADELKKLRYNKDRGLKVDKIAELFGKYKTKVRYDVLQYIRKNPQTFLKRVVDLYGDKLGPMLKEKGFVELNESIDYNNKEMQNIIIDILYEDVCGDQEKHTGEQGGLFTMDSSENLGVTDMFVDDGFDLVHKHGNNHLSDISPEENETLIPQGSKKVKKQVLKPNLNIAPYNIKIKESSEKGHYGHVFSDKIPIELDNKLYVLTNKLGGVTHREINNFIEKTDKETLHILQGLLRDFPSSLVELQYYYGNLDSLRNSDDYKRIINFVKRIGFGERIVEDSDVFGQGLLDPIDPEEFEGDDGEWEELVGDVENDEFDNESQYQYTGGKTDAEKGFVAPSSEVTDNICNVEGICNAQGPITFGQLKALVEEATTKRIRGDMGRGMFKTLWRIVPFFIPQVLLAAVGITVTRAINKIVTPALKDTRGYKSWWGKVVLKAMDVAEGDYIPDVAIGDDPLSKIFFISDGLLQMIRDKYKLKFARYVAEVASNEPDNKPVPEWFVENLLRDYLNQKFLLDPQLPIKTDVERKELSEMDIDDRHPERDGQGEGENKTDSGTFEQPGDDFTKPLEPHRLARDREFIPEPSKHSKGGVVETIDNFSPEGLKAEDRIQQTINNYLDSEYEVKLRGYPNKEAIRFESKRSGEVLSPRLIIREIAKIFGSGKTHAIEQYLHYTVHLKMKGTVENVNFQIDEDRTPNYPGSPDSFRSLHRDRVNDDKLDIPPATLVSYLDKYHRERLIKELTPSLKCIAYNCYEAWNEDLENLNPDNTREVADQYCEECSEELIDRLLELDREVVKMGFVKTRKDVGNEDELRNRIKDYPIINTLEKPFPFTYNDWLENIIQEVDPKFFINTKDDIVYMEENTPVITEQKENDLNPDVEEGDVIELIHMDDPWGISPMTRGIVVGFESMGSMGDKILVRWIIKTEEGEEEFRNLPLIKDVDYWRIANPLIENINEEDQKDFELERFGNVLVRAYFTYGGGWGQNPKSFVVYLTPSGTVKGVSLNQGMTNRDVPFKEGDKVNLGDLIKFEENSKFDLQMKGRIREGVINEQKENIDLSKMTPALWKVLKVLDKLMGGKWNPRVMKLNLEKYFDMPNHSAELYLILKHNSPDIHDLLTNGDWKDIKIPTFFETEMEYYGNEWDQEEDETCEDGYGEMTGDECDCNRFEEALVIRENEYGKEEEEFVSCGEMGEEDLEKYFGIDDIEDCPCEEYHRMVYTVYWNDIQEKTILSTIPILDILEVSNWNQVTAEELEFSERELMSHNVVITEHQQTDDNYDSSVMWEEFEDRTDEIIDVSEEYTADGGELIYEINKKLYSESQSINEQEQLKMWPTGEFKYPVGHLDDDEIKHVEDSLPDNVVKMIFRQWDKKGVDHNILKLLGITEGVDLLMSMLLKRYIQFSQNPIPVSYTFDCDDLANLFEIEIGKDEYIKQYLCGDDAYNETEDWFNFKWDTYMTDQIDESNWKTISSIFGGVSQEVAEHILSEQPQNEEEEELIEKYEGEIDDIQHYILWANNDESTYGILNAMGKDIDDKLAEHFQEYGKLTRDEDGSISWTINGDLRNWINDKWDNTEDVFEHHTDYIGETIESIMMNDLNSHEINTTLLFSLLVEEEFMMGEYCEGKRGECLQVDTRWFDGYWQPDYDINETLRDRLTELTYEPTKPIQEQDSEEVEKPNLDETPFTKLDVSIMNRLSKMFTQQELHSLWEEGEESQSGKGHTKFINFIKLFGENTSNREGWAKATRFAKWCDDNWAEAEILRAEQLGTDLDPTIIYELDFGLVTQPVKEWPSLYRIHGTESYWIKEYQYGETDVAGFSKENAENIAKNNWYEYDVDMETGDGGGDTDDHDLEIDSYDTEYLKSLKEARIQGLIFESGMLMEMDFDRNDLLKLAQNTKGGISRSRPQVYEFLTHLQHSGLVNMFQSPDFLWSGKGWLTKWLDLYHPDKLEDPDENIQHLLDNADKVRDILIIILMDRADREGRMSEIDDLNKEMRPLAQDMFKIWSAQL